jgi:Nuclease-related domain
MPGSRRLKLPRSDDCSVCGIALAAGTVAFWDADAKTVTCLGCLGGPAVQEVDVVADTAGRALDRGVPGASARRRYERLHTAREQRARDKFGRFGGVYLALTNDPQSTVAWAQGSRGERLLGEYLEKIQDEEVVVVLHDRRIPGTRANIDHLAVGSGVVWAIDAKNYSGKIKCGSPTRIGVPRCAGVGYSDGSGWREVWGRVVSLGRVQAGAERS